MLNMRILHAFFIIYRYGAFIDKDGKGEGNLGQWGDHRASKTLRRSSVCSAPYEKRGIITLWRSLTSAVSLSGMVKGDNGSSTSISGVVNKSVFFFN